MFWVFLHPIKSMLTLQLLMVEVAYESSESM